MLHVDPKMLGRLDEIHTDLLARRAHAETQGWLGEIEGIDLTLRFLAEKRAETQRLAHVDRDQDTVTVLGMPTHRSTSMSNASTSTRRRLRTRRAAHPSCRPVTGNRRDRACGMLIHTQTRWRRRRGGSSS